jgi:SAM-dependent methyltransferase
METLLADRAELAYEALAGDYDAFTADYDYERWLSEVERVARALGLRGRRLLDLACGTGNGFLPMLERGYEVTACDLSPSMLARAAGKAPGARLFVADLRALPAAGSFDLVTCMGDSLNYLGDARELERCFEGVAANLAADGRFVFDLNTRLTYRTAFAGAAVTERDDRVFVWRGEGGTDATCSAVLDVFAAEDGVWRRRTSTHVQHHFPREAVEAALARAGLRALAVFGQTPGPVLHPEPDEDAHTKALYVAAREEVTPR